MAIVRSYLELIRIHNCLLAAASVWVGSYLTSIPASFISLLPAMLLVFLICGFGNVLNDLCDIASDRINHPQRPLPSGRLTIAQGWTALALLIIGSMIPYLFVQLITGVIVVISVLLLVWYNLQLKHLPVVGNIIVSILAALTFLVGGVEAGLENLWQVPGPIIPAIFALLMHSGRELIKDIQDKGGDILDGGTTLPVKYGSMIALNISNNLFIVMSLAGIAIFAFGWFNLAYLAILLAGVIAPIILQMIWLFHAPDQARAGRVASLLRLEMLIGLVALVVGKAY